MLQIATFLSLGGIFGLLVFYLVSLAGTIVLVGVAIGINLSNHNNKILTRILVIEMVIILIFLISGIASLVSHPINLGD